MNKSRYILVRGYHSSIDNKIKTEEIECDTLEEAINLGSILSFEESIMSYIFDTVNRKKLTLQGK
jgi:hypothetical protein